MSLINKNFEYLKKIKERQRQKYFSPESIQKRKEKAIEYQKNAFQRKKGLKKFSNKMVALHEKDAIFYEEIWNKNEHYCENCGCFLGNNFRLGNGNIIVYRYAHILPKSIYPYLRHFEPNVMLLCLTCHVEFDNSPKEVVEKMRCYNDRHIENLKMFHKKLEQENNEIYK